MRLAGGSTANGTTGRRRIATTILALVQAQTWTSMVKTFFADPGLELRKMKISPSDIHSLMSALTMDELPIGTPLPFAVLDSDGTLILEPAAVVSSEHERALLFTCCEPRRLVSDAGSARGTGSGVATPSLDDLNLRIGMRIQIRLTPGSGYRNAVGAVIGFTPNHMIFITTPREAGHALAFHEGELLQLRGFSGESVFAFVCTVEQVVHRPVEYVVLSEPAQIRRMQIRHGMRVPTRLITRVDGSASGRAANGALALVTDLSATGLAMRAAEPIAAVGDMVQLQFMLRGRDVCTQIGAVGEVRHVSKPESTPAPFTYGVEFRQLDPTQSVALKCFVYERLAASH